MDIIMYILAVGLFSFCMVYGILMFAEAWAKERIIQRDKYKNELMTTLMAKEELRVAKEKLGEVDSLHLKWIMTLAYKLCKSGVAVNDPAELSVTLFNIVYRNKESLENLTKEQFNSILLTQLLINDLQKTSEVPKLLAYDQLGKDIC